MIANAGPITLPNSGAKAPYLRVYMSGGYVTLAAATQADVGTLNQRCLAADAYATVVPAIVNWPVLMVAGNGAIAQFAAVYGYANGTISNSSGGGAVYVGIALDAASGTGSIIRVLRQNTAISGTLARTNLIQDALQPYTLSLFDARIAAGSAVLGASAGTPSGAMGLTPGTHGSATPILVGEAASGNSKSDSVRFLFTLPPEYEAAETVKLRLHAKITGDVAVAQTVDAQVYESDLEAGVSADLCATAAQTITDAYADYDFTITATALEAGDVLDILITAAANDTGGTANKYVIIGAVQLLADIKG